MQYVNIICSLSPCQCRCIVLLSLMCGNSYRHILSCHGTEPGFGVKVVAHVSNNWPPLLGYSVPGFLTANIQKYFVIFPCPSNYNLVLIFQVHQVVGVRWISQSDEIMKDHTSCDDFSACLWFIVSFKTLNLCTKIPKAFSTTSLALESL